MSTTDSVINTRNLHTQAEQTIQKPKRASAKKSPSITKESMCGDENPIGYYYLSRGPNHSVPEAIAVLKYRLECKERWSGAWTRFAVERRRPPAVRPTTYGAVSSLPIAREGSIEPLAVMIRDQQGQNVQQLRGASASFTTGR